MKDVRLDGGALVAQRDAGLGWRTALRDAVDGLRGLASDVVTAALPALCTVCDGPLVVFSRLPVCEDCWGAVKPLEGRYAGVDLLCARCGDGLPMESRLFEIHHGIRLCAHCRSNAPAYARAVAYGAFDAELRRLIRALKYERLQELAEGRLGRMMASAALRLCEDLPEGALVVPVPLALERHRERGYNQAALLARAMCAALKGDTDWPLELREDLLLRTRETPALYGLTREQRRDRLRGVFQVNKALRAVLEGRDVLLVDDIMTTGATAEACTSVLLRAGARKVCVVTLARTQRETEFAMWHPGRANSQAGVQV